MDLYKYVVSVHLSSLFLTNPYNLCREQNFMANGNKQQLLCIYGNLRSEKRRI